MVMRVPGGRLRYRLVDEVIESERLVLVCRIGALCLWRIWDGPLGSRAGGRERAQSTLSSRWCLNALALGRAASF